jgi:hypothetical protein
MSKRRFSVPLLALILILPTLSCQDRTDPVSPVEPQFAKGGKPSKPTEPAPFELLEYFIHRDETEGNVVHIAGKGAPGTVTLYVVQDYFFNATRDVFDLFFEYSTGAPGTFLVEEVGELDPDQGTFHIDIPWNGETKDLGIQFPDYPQVDGPDPYAFDIIFRTVAGDYISESHPQGILFPGVDAGASNAVIESDHHPGVNDVYSYAAFDSPITEPPAVYIDEIAVDENSFACEVVTIRERVDGVKETRQVRRVSGPAKVVVRNYNDGAIADGRIDVHLATGTADSPVFNESFISTRGTSSWADGWGVSSEFSGGEGEFEFFFIVDYVYATDLENSFVYDPSKNRNVGFETHSFSSSEFLGSWPYAVVGPLTVDCR